MAAAQKDKKVWPKFPHLPVRTPTAVASFAHVHTPDDYMGQSKFKITLVMPGDADLEPLETAAQKVGAICFPKLKAEKLNVLIKSGDDQNDVLESKGKDPRPELAGKHVIVASCSAAKDEDGNFKYAPKIVGPDRKPLPKNMKVFSGDLVKAIIEPIPSETPSFGTITWRLIAVQLIEKRSGSGVDVDSMFDDEGEGFGSGGGGFDDETKSDGEASATAAEDSVDEEEMPF